MVGVPITLQTSRLKKAGGDIVGDEFGNQSGFYKRYDDGSLDGIESLGFRIRLADNTSSYIFIGFDVEDGVGDLNPDGAIDFYVAINFGSGNAKHNEIAFYDPGTGLNVSPSTSDFSYHSNYIFGDDPNVADYAALDPVVLGGNEGFQGSGASDDLDGGLDTDYFLSFQVDLASLNTAYQDISGTTNTIAADTEMMLIMGSSTNGQNVNQDFGGLDGSTNATLPWADPNGIGAPIYTTEGTSPVPESGTYALIFGAVAGAFVLIRRRR